ncbi:MAG: carbohydrate ABC transporter permease [Armatimonadota bacterium]
MRARKLIGSVAAHAVLAGLALLVAFPFVWMLLTALKSPAEALAYPPQLFPESPRWGNFPEAWQAAPFARYFGNTLLVAGSVLASVVATSLPAAYAFALLEFPGRRLLFGLYLATLMIPFEVVLIPNFVTVSQLGWYDTYWAMIVPWGASVFAVFLVTQSLRSLPRDYLEAAQLDGCGHLRFLWSVAAPLVRPALATAGLFAFLGSWNALLWPLLVTQTEAIRPIEVGLQVFLADQAMRPHLLMAASTLAMLPVLLLFLLAQRTFIEGVTAGIKG